MYSPNQPRGSNGKFVSAAHHSEAAHRESKRYPTAPHAGVRSVGSHRGFTVTALNERTGNFEIVSTGKRRAVAESIARGQRFDKKLAKIF